MYTTNALPQRFAPQIAFTDFFAAYGVEGIKRVADVYDSTMARGKSHADAVKLLNDNASMFGVPAFNDELLRNIFNYANSKVGRISGNIKDNPFENTHTDRKINLETGVRREYSRSTVTPINEARAYRTVRDHKYEEPSKVIPFARSSSAQKKSTIRELGRLALASGIVAYITLNPFSGLFGKKYVEDARAQTAQTGIYQPKPADDYKKVLEKLREAPSQKGAAPTLGQPPAVAAQAPQPATAVPPAAKPAFSPTLAQIAQPSTSVATKVADHSAYNKVSNQREEHHEKFMKGEVKYADLNDRVKAWFSLRHSKSELKQDGDKYGILVNQPSSYKQADLGDFYVGGKVAGKWHYGQRPNKDFLVGLTKQQYDALKDAKNRVGQVVFYKVEEKDGKPIVRIYASLNYEKLPVKEPAVAAQPAPLAPPTVKLEIPKVELPKVELPKSNHEDNKSRLFTLLDSLR